MISNLLDTAFKGCNSLKTIYLPGSCNAIGSDGFSYDSSFTDCSSLMYVKGAYNVTFIHPYCFVGCSSLLEIDLKSVTWIGEACFLRLSKLIDVGDVSNVETVYWAAFKECQNLTKVNFSNKLKTTHGSLFYGCTKLESVGDISGLSVITDNMFFNCQSLQKVSALSVQEIQNAAFYQCVSLQYLKITAEVPPTLGTNVFYGTTFIIYVPDDSVDSYKSATNWSVYADRIKAISTFIEP